MKNVVPKIAVIDDYQNVALSVADWSPLNGRAEISVFNDHVADANALVDRLKSFDIVCVMRERTPLPRTLLEQLPNLKLIASTGTENGSIDVVAAEDLGISVLHTGYSSTPTIEFTWALILSMARNIPLESHSVRTGGWQLTLGDELAGKTLGLLGLGRVGSAVGTIGRAFGMNVIAWSQNLTPAAAKEYGIKYVTKSELFMESDFLSIHVRLSDRTRHLVGATELATMKSTSRLINTSRGPVVDGAALVEALSRKLIAGAALDVFDVEPLEQVHPLRELTSVLATPHIGYVSRELYRTFYGDTVQNIVHWLDERGYSRND